MGDWTNPCGGVTWRELPDGRIEVDGRGIPLYEPGSARYRLVEQTWDNWGRLFVRASRDHGVPVSWLVAIASVETGPWSDDPSEQAEAVSYAGARGVMQIMPATASQILDRDPDAMFNPAANIDAGAELIAITMRNVRSGLPAICGVYNSGNVCCKEPPAPSGTVGCKVGCQNQFRICTHGDYPLAAIMYNNTALTYLDLSAGPQLATMLGLGLLAVGAAGFWMGLRK
jgi:hypothetical protein